MALLPRLVDTATLYTAESGRASDRAGPATVGLSALRLLGCNARLYDGSLTEWCADPDLPLEVG